MRSVVARFTVFQMLCALALLLLAQPALSAPNVPKGQPFTILSPGDVAPVCDFPVRIEGISAQNAHATLPNGLIVIAGPAVATVTNLSTGTSATYNISGPYLYDPATNRVIVFGTNLIIGPEGSSGPPRTKFLIVTSGTVSFILDQPIDVPLRGTVTHNVCAELA